jgi:hypothetical protein
VAVGAGCKHFESCLAAKPAPMTFEKKNLHTGCHQVLDLPGLRHSLDGSLHLVIAALVA